MRHFIAALAVTLIALPAVAQDGPQDAPTNEGGSLMERGLRLFMEGLMDEMEPALRDLEDLAEDARPFLEEMQRSLGEVVKDFDAYEAPEILPNGDILIRRKHPLENPFPDSEPMIPDDGDGAIDL